MVSILKKLKRLCSREGEPNSTPPEVEPSAPPFEDSFGKVEPPSEALPSGPGEFFVVEVTPEKICAICMDNSSTHAVVPCGHKCACKTCSDKIQATTGKCPMCRKEIECFIRIFECDVNNNNNDAKTVENTIASLKNKHNIQLQQVTKKLEEAESKNNQHARPFIKVIKDDFIKAAKDGNVQVVQDYINSGANLNVQQKYGWTALHEASWKGKTECLSLLIGAGADYDVRQKNGWTALHLASWHDNTECVKLLIVARADLNVQDEYGLTALHLASKNGKTECVRRLIGAGADFNIQQKNGQTALHWASWKGKTECLSLLIGAGADYDVRQKNGWTALHLASRWGNLECVKLLIDARADLNVKEEDGWTALHLASCNGKTECVKLLIAAGADKNIPTTKDWSNYKAGSRAIDFARKRGYIEIVKLLQITRKFVKEVQEQFLKAAKDGNTAAVHHYIHSGADLNVHDKKYGRTALHLASKNGKTECVKLLIDAGADLNVPDEKDGDTPLMVASWNGKTECVKLFVQAEANFNVQDKYGWTALQYASGSGNAECVKLLLDAGAARMILTTSDSCDGVHKAGSRAIDIARKLENIEIVKLLQITKKSVKEVQDQFIKAAQDGCGFAFARPPLAVLASELNQVVLECECSGDALACMGKLSADGVASEREEKQKVDEWIGKEFKNYIELHGRSDAGIERTDKAFQEGRLVFSMGEEFQKWLKLYRPERHYDQIQNTFPRFSTETKLVLATASMLEAQRELNTNKNRGL